MFQALTFNAGGITEAAAPRRQCAKPAEKSNSTGAQQKTIWMSIKYDSDEVST